MEAVATLLALRAGIAPPNLGHGEPDPDIRLVALSHSFGFGGHNAVLCLAVDPEETPA